MSEQVSSQGTGAQPGAGQGSGQGDTQSARALTRRPAGEGALQSSRGATTIADSVVAKVAGIAAREVPGVFALGGGAARALGSVTQRVGIGDARTQGVNVEVGERQAAVDLTAVVEYGESIPQVCQQIREQVIKRIEGLVGLEVTEVNIAVDDLHFPGDDAEEAEVARVA